FGHSCSIYSVRGHSDRIYPVCSSELYIASRRPCSAAVPYSPLSRSRLAREGGVPRLPRDGGEAAVRRQRAGRPPHHRRAGCAARDRKSTRLNSSHLGISYAGFCLKEKKT